MTWKLRLNACPNALAMLVVLHGLPGLGNDFAMVGHALLFFKLVSMVGMGRLPFVFTLLCGVAYLYFGWRGSRLPYQ